MPVWERNTPSDRPARKPVRGCISRLCHCNLSEREPTPYLRRKLANFLRISHKFARLCLIKRDACPNMVYATAEVPGPNEFSARFTKGRKLHLIGIIKLFKRRKKFRKTTVCSDRGRCRALSGNKCHIWNGFRY